jgi:mono/diheme cytochrome c family protein
MVHTLALPDIAPPELPDAPGRSMLLGACSTCHTLRYVLDQPPLPRRQWAAEVDKMRHAYGAPFPDEMTGPIVDYLVAVRGTDAF